jgi:CHAD domain-containing protein
MGAPIQPADGALAAAHRELLAQLDAAIRGLRQPVATDAGIHEIRKGLKRARAALRLLRQCIGLRQYRRDNAAIRDAARPLIALRDCKMVLETLRDLLPAGERRLGPFARQLRRELCAQRLAERTRLRPRILLHSAAMLRTVRRRIAALPLKKRKGPQPIEGLRHAFKVGRKAFRRARDRCTDERLHEWRKQTKYFGSQLEILEPFGPKSFAKKRKSANRLADALGDDHDLAVLAGRIRRFNVDAKGLDRNEGAAELLGPLTRRREKLQRRAFRLGARLFGARPPR